MGVGLIKAQSYLKAQFPPEMALPEITLQGVFKFHLKKSPRLKVSIPTHIKNIEIFPNDTVERI